MLPDSLDKDRKQAIQRQMGVELNKMRGAPRASRGRSPFAAREMSGHIDRRDGKLFAHVVVPHCSAQYSEWEKNFPYFQEFTKKLHGIVADLLAQKPDGWLVDLRGNGGGNMWPMLGGITAILGEGDLGSFRAPGGGGSTWFLKDGTVSTRPGVGNRFESRTPGRTLRSRIFPGWRAVRSRHRKFGRGGGDRVCRTPSVAFVGAYRRVLHRQSEFCAAGWSDPTVVLVGGGGSHGPPVSRRPGSRRGDSYSRIATGGGCGRGDSSGGGVDFVCGGGSDDGTVGVYAALCPIPLPRNCACAPKTSTARGTNSIATLWALTAFLPVGSFECREKIAALHVTPTYACSGVDPPNEMQGADLGLLGPAPDDVHDLVPRNCSYHATRPSSTQPKPRPWSGSSSPHKRRAPTWRIGRGGEASASR